VIDDTTAPNTPPGLPRRAVLRFLFWSRRVRLERNLAIVLAFAAVAAGTATFAAMTGNLPMAVDTWDILLLLNLDLVLLLALGALISRRLVYVWVASKRGAAGARLHARLVGLFSLLAVTPTIIIAVFSVIMFDFGLQGWFSDRVRTAPESAGPGLALQRGAFQPAGRDPNGPAVFDRGRGVRRLRPAFGARRPREAALVPAADSLLGRRPGARRQGRHPDRRN
jgi:hypothetical protein